MTAFTGFDPRSLLTTTVKAKLDTRLTPLPLDETDEFLVRCEKVNEPKIVTNPDGRQWCAYESEWLVIDQAVPPHVNRRARYSFELEVNEGGLDTREGHNVKLGALNEALGLKTGWALEQHQGLTCFAKIKHRPDKDDDTILYNQIVRVTAEPKRRNGRQ
jgi:hypothetical protein